MEVSQQLTKEGLLQKARLKGNIEYAEKLIRIDLWFKLKEYVDEVYGEECVYIYWRFSVDDFIGLNITSTHDVTRAYVPQKSESSKAYLRFIHNTDAVKLLYAYSIDSWDRKNIDLGPNLEPEDRFINL